MAHLLPGPRIAERLTKQAFWTFPLLRCCPLQFCRQLQGELSIEVALLHHACQQMLRKQQQEQHGKQQPRLQLQRLLNHTTAVSSQHQCASLQAALLQQLLCCHLNASTAAQAQLLSAVLVLLHQLTVTGQKHQQQQGELTTAGHGNFAGSTIGLSSQLRSLEASRQQAVQEAASLRGEVEALEGVLNAMSVAYATVLASKSQDRVQLQASAAQVSQQLHVTEADNARLLQQLRSARKQLLAAERDLASPAARPGVARRVFLQAADDAARRLFMVSDCGRVPSAFKATGVNWWCE